MLLLPLLALAAAWSHGQAQVILKQTDVSVTRGQTKTAWIDCVGEGISDFKSAYIHWYRQIPPKAPERVLYIGSGLALYDDDSYRNKYTSSKKGTNVCTFSVEDINSNDEGTYYCAYWQYADVKIFGSGTKLIVSNEVISSPASSEILQKRHENQIMYVCLIEKFYPEVIRVTWTDEADKEVTDNIIKGDVWKPTNGDKYSIGSWLTVPAENKDKNYYCKYEHESQQRSLSTQDSRKTATQQKDCSPGNSTVNFNKDHLMHRTAYLVYIVLLLKSSMYYLIVLFLIYRMWAPTKHQGKKA